LFYKKYFRNVSRREVYFRIAKVYCNICRQMRVLVLLFFTYIFVISINAETYREDLSWIGEENE